MCPDLTLSAHSSIIFLNFSICVIDWPLRAIYTHKIPASWFEVSLWFSRRPNFVLIKSESSLSSIFNLPFLSHPNSNKYQLFSSLSRLICVPVAIPKPEYMSNSYLSMATISPFVVSGDGVICTIVEMLKKKLLDKRNLFIYSTWMTHKTISLVMNSGGRYSQVPICMDLTCYLFQYHVMVESELLTRFLGHLNPFSPRLLCCRCASYHVTWWECSGLVLW